MPAQFQRLSSKKKRKLDPPSPLSNRKRSRSVPLISGKIRPTIGSVRKGRRARMAWIAVSLLFLASPKKKKSGDPHDPAAGSALCGTTYAVSVS
jgi:hypothetical protein